MILNFKLALGLLTLNILDLVTTMYGLGLPNVIEMNPYCSTFVLFLKVFLCGFLVWISLKIDNFKASKYALTIMLTFLVIYYMLIIMNNVIVILQVLLW